MDAFAGVYGTIPTPFGADEEVDETALRKVIDSLFRRGLHGIVAVGSMGEFAYLSESERLKVCEISVDEARGRGKVIVGTSAQSTREAIRYSREAERAGADGVMVVPPWYGFPTSAELEAHYRDIAHAVDIPLVPYNNSFTTGGNIPPEVLAKLAEREPSIRNCKETTADISRITQILSLTDKLTVLCGTDNLLLASYVAGARGLMTAMAVIAPELCLQLHVLAKQQRWEEARALNDRLLPLGNFLETGRFVPFAKAAMARTGLPVGLPRRPALPISESDERSLCETMTPLARLVD